MTLHLGLVVLAVFFILFAGTVLSGEWYVKGAGKHERLAYTVFRVHVIAICTLLPVVAILAWATR